MKCKYCKENMSITEQQVHECPKCGAKETGKK